MKTTNQPQKNEASAVTPVIGSASLIKFKVTLFLMVDPLIDDKTFKKTYEVQAEDSFKAYREALKKQSEDSPEIKYRSVFDYKVTLG